MSWLSKALDFGKKAISTVAKVALPIASSLVGALPVIGGIGAKLTDTLGNKLIEGLDGPPPELAAANVIDNAVTAAAANNNNPALSKPSVNFTGAPTYLGASAAGDLSSNFLGIGGSAPGVLGIGDGKPGVLGIGTGKAKARKAAEAAATAAGSTPAAVKAAGDRAAANVEETGSADGDSNIGLIAAAAAAALLLFL